MPWSQAVLFMVVPPLALVMALGTYLLLHA